MCKTVFKEMGEEICIVQKAEKKAAEKAKKDAEEKAKKWELLSYHKNMYRTNKSSYKIFKNILG